MIDLRDGETGPVGAEVRLCKPAVPGALPVIRAAIGNFVKHLVPAARSYDIQLAVTEAATNVVRHAYPSGSGDLICHAEASDDEILIRICDRGRTFGPPSLGTGFGTPLMAQLSDGFTRTNSDGMNVVELRFRRTT